MGPGARLAQLQPFTLADLASDVIALMDLLEIQVRCLLLEVSSFYGILAYCGCHSLLLRLPQWQITDCLFLCAVTVVWSRGLSTATDGGHHGSLHGRHNCDKGIGAAFASVTHHSPAKDSAAVSKSLP
jgi:hypothetical protein